MNNRNFTAETQKRREYKQSLLILPLRLCVSAVSVFAACFAVAAADSTPLYQNSFTTNEVGKLPGDMLLLDGGFVVQEVAGDKVLQLPGAPLETFGVLFGPTEASGLAASARVHST